MRACKKLWHKLQLEHHPDREGGTKLQTQQLNHVYFFYKEWHEGFDKPEPYLQGLPVKVKAPPVAKREGERREKRNREDIQQRPSFSYKYTQRTEAFHSAADAADDHATYWEEEKARELERKKKRKAREARWDAEDKAEEEAKLKVLICNKGK